KDLKQLNSLYLSSNQISDISFPKDLKQLNSLYLSYNQISDISFLKDLKQLNSLDLSDNKISELPVWITENRMEITLEQFGSGIILYENPLKKPPPEIIKQGKDAIKNYFKYEQFDYLFEAKLILVGEERAGKSTIAKALHQDDFKINLNEESTKGIDVIKWIIPKKNVKTDKDYRFNIWDFGGQEIYHATHQFFLTKRSLYLFVTEARKDLRFDDFYYWLNIINSLAGKSPVLLVQNKADQPHQIQSIEKHKENFPQIHEGLLTVSCNTEHENWHTKYCYLLKGLKGTIFEIVKNKLIEGIGDPLPKEWITIRKNIAEINEDYISLLDYYKICKKYNIDKKGALHLSDYFHHLGVFLHFKDDISLRNTIFLNHEWVTKGIYNVFENDKIKNQTKGKFKDSDLLELWDEPQFRGKEADLLNLMKNPEFKICYQHKDGYYLAPQLFDDKEIGYEWRTNEDNLIFRYNYSFMPKGILSQLIVMLNKYIYKDAYWKYGVLLDYKNTRAIVIENRYDNKNIISIRVEGELRQTFLSIIGNKIEEINSTYTNLEVIEEFGCICKECKTLDKPNFWESITLNRAMQERIDKLRCFKSFKEISINRLIGNYIPYHQKREVSDKSNLISIQNVFKNQDKDYSKEFDEIHRRFDKTDKNFTKTHKYQEEINLKLDNIIKEFNDISKENQNTVIDELTNFITNAFNANIEVLNEDIQEKFKKFNKKDNFELKIKASVPLLKELTGINIEA
ncbi:MAG: GTP-binding protein, partial [Arcobacter sp.]|nr:GTP-binding protein [Arcobacter sp.]